MTISGGRLRYSRDRTYRVWYLTRSGAASDTNLGNRAKREPGFALCSWLCGDRVWYLNRPGTGWDTNLTFEVDGRAGQAEP
jgi:hypothetical protein